MLKCFLVCQRPLKSTIMHTKGYHTDEGKPWVLPVVERTYQQEATSFFMKRDTTLMPQYMSVAVDPVFRSAAIDLLLGKDHPAVLDKIVVGIQVHGRTGGFRLAAEFLKRHCNSNVVYVSTPTWDNHKTTFKHTGFSEIREYRYWNPNTHEVDFEGLIEDLENATEKSIIILHAVAHEPTGMDLIHEQWIEVAKIVKRRQLFPVFDCTYQGVATGDLIADAWAVRYFVGLGLPLFAVQSFSTSFGLYEEGVGHLCIVGTSNDMVNETVTTVLHQMETLAATLWSTLTNIGSRAVTSVLRNTAYFEEWKGNLKTMSDRLELMRTSLYERLKKEAAPGHWRHISRQVGLFSFTGLTEEQSEAMVKEHHVYMLKNGRISVAGLTTNNVNYVVDAMVDVLT